MASPKPFLAARFGDAELRALVYTIENDMGIRNGFLEYIKKVMNLNAGFFLATEDNQLHLGAGCGMRQLRWMCLASEEPDGMSGRKCKVF